MICPNLKCGRTIVTADSARGKVVRCVHCQTLFLVPKNENVAGDVKPEGQQTTEADHRENR